MKQHIPLFPSWLLTTLLIVGLPFMAALASSLPPELPVATNDQANTLQNTWVSIHTISNDSGSAIFLHTIPTQPTNGTAQILPGKTNVLYTPNPGFIGTDSFPYVIRDYYGETATAVITVTVITAGQLGAVNVAPTPIYGLEFCTQPLTPLVICESWTDPNGHEWDIDIDQSYTTFHCSLVALNDSCLRYTPLPGFVGTDTISIVVCDNQMPSLCSTSTALVYVGCVTPQANPDVVAITNAATVINGVTISGNGLSGALLPVTNNDEAFCSTTLSLAQITVAPEHGTAVLSGGQILYTPISGYSGPDVLQYSVCNNCGACQSTTVNIAVSGGSSGNCTIAEAVCTPPFNTIQICPTFCGVSNATLGAINASVNGTGSLTPLGANCFTYTTSTVFSGTDVITFSACDAAGNCSTNTTTVTISAACGGNNPPLAVNDNFVALPGETLLLNVLSNDNDPDGQTLAITQLLTPIACGTVSIVGNQLLYTVGDTCTIGDCFEYIICDNGSPALCDTAKVFIEIQNTQPPCNFETDYCSAPMQPVQICVEFCNVPDAVITGANTTFNCSINIQTETCLQYIALPGYVGTDVVEITGCNQLGQCENVTVYVHVGCTAPQAVNDSTTLTNTGNDVPVNVLANDSHICNEPIFVQPLLNPVNGTIQVNDNQTISYLPQTDFSGTDQFTYLACVNCTTGTLCDTAVVVLTVLPDATTPLTAQPDVATTPQGTPATINVLNNDNGSGLSVTAVSQPANGTVVINAGTTLTYTPNPGFTGTETFTYTVCDVLGNCLTENVFITVTPSAVNLPPVANNDTANTLQDTPVQIPVTNNDADPDNALAQLTATITNPPNSGTAVVGANNMVTYTPNAGFTGTDTFTYTLCDPAGLCDEATVTILVVADLPVDAQPDLVFTTLNTPVTFNVLANDLGDDIAVTQVTVLPINGSIVSFNPLSGEVNYQPNPGFLGNDYFVYEICNPDAFCDITLVSITVQTPMINHPPTPNNDVAETLVNTPVSIPVLLNDTDPDNQPLTVAQVVTSPQNGTTTINANGTITYTPNPGFTGCNVFTYSVCDPLAACATVQVGVQVGNTNCLNQHPIAANDATSATENVPVVIAVLNNDFDPDGNIVTLTLAANPYHGTATALPGNAGFVYNSNDDFIGTDFFPYIICDNGTPALCDTAYVTITVLPNQILAQPDVFYTSVNVPISFNVLTNDSGTAIQVSQVFGGPDFGTLSVTPITGTIAYTPNPGFIGTDYFEYQICDVVGSCDITLVTIIVQPITTTNLPPVAVNDMANTPLNTPITITVLANDYDPFGGTAITVSNTLPALPANGTATVNPNGTVTYTPQTGFAGTDQFQYTVCDNGLPAICATATVVVIVGSETSSNLPPNAVNDQATTPLNTPVTIPVLDNDTDPNPDALTLTWVSTPAYGAAQIEPNGTVTYTPNTNFIGNDYFAYTICDNGIPTLCDTAYVSIFVDTDELIFTAETPENTPITLCLTNLMPTVNVDTVSVEAIPENGGVVLIDNCVQYTPNPNFTDNDTFTLLVCTPDGNCITTVFYITVLEVNEPPIAVNDTATTEQDTPIVVDVLANDSDPDGDAITAVVITQQPAVSGATVSLDLATLEPLYTPASGFSGIDSFAYIITDATGLSSNTAWVVITINGLPPQPLNIAAVNDTATTDVNMPITIPILGNDTLPQPQPVVIITLLNFPQNGSAVVEPVSGSITYIPNVNFVGTDNFDYIICIPDGQGASVCDTATVFIAILPDTTACILGFAQGFSPNGDGTNETYLITNAECYEANLPELTIFNRWGDVVYAVKGYTNTLAWDGTWNGRGENVPDGTYFYLFDPKTGNQNDLKSGFIELHR